MPGLEPAGVIFSILVGSKQACLTMRCNAVWCDLTCALAVRLTDEFIGWRSGRVEML